MPFRKNLGFKRSLRVERATTVRRRGSEYSVECQDDPVTEVLPSIRCTDAGERRMVSSPEVEKSTWWIRAEVRGGYQDATDRPMSGTAATVVW
jgi:hypothetical protein